MRRAWTWASLLAIAGLTGCGEVEQEGDGDADTDTDADPSCPSVCAHLDECGVAGDDCIGTCACAALHLLDEDAVVPLQTCLATAECGLLGECYPPSGFRPNGIAAERAFACQERQEDCPGLRCGRVAVLREDVAKGLPSCFDADACPTMGMCLQDYFEKICAGWGLF